VNDLRAALSACKGAFFSAGIFSLFINLLMLTPTIYMLTIYDRVLSSSSKSTLLMLSLITMFLILVMGGLEWIRSQLLIISGTRLDHLLRGRVFDSIFAQTLASYGQTASAQPLNDLLQLRQFLTGQGLFAFFDAPWMPLYFILLFLFHWTFGVFGLLSAMILAGLAFWNDFATRRVLEKANQESLSANQLVQRSLRNAEVIEAMGMLPRLRRGWEEKQQRVLTLQEQASRSGGLIAVLSKTYRLASQSLVLGLGAYLAIEKEISPGMVIAGSILLGRALAPLDLMIGTWRGALQAREAYQRLSRLLGIFPQREPLMSLPLPKGHIALEGLVIQPEGAGEPILKGLTFNIDAGDQVAVIGPSAAGKSTFARAILGIYRPSKGHVRLDGGEIHQWNREQLGEYLGYLPQDVELLDGTVAENIARFGTIDPDRVVEAARLAGVHEMVLRLPEGYGTRLWIGGPVLSAGQQQRIGIARAVYGNPVLIVLDEPNANLDQAGEAALSQTLALLKSQAKTLVVITHRVNILNQVDKILLLVDGQVALYGPRDEALKAMAQPPPSRPSPSTALAPAGTPPPRSPID
jgi:ATP-binding cassette subfamily C protein EexD